MNFRQPFFMIKEPYELLTVTFLRFLDKPLGITSFWRRQ